MNKLETLKKWIQESDNIVFFGGAGVSTESGIKDFRSPDGLYNENLGTNCPISTVSGNLVPKKQGANYALKMISDTWLSSRRISWMIERQKRWRSSLVSEL